MKELQEAIGAYREADSRYQALLAESKGPDGAERLDNIKSVSDPKGEFDRLLNELEEKGKSMRELQAIEQRMIEASETKAYIDGLENTIIRPDLNGPEDKPGDVQPFRSIGQQWVESQQYKSMLGVHEGNGPALTIEQSMKEWLPGGQIRERQAIRAIFDNTDFDPFEAQVPDIVSRPWGGPRMFLSMIPQIPIMSDSGRYHRLTTRTEPSDYSIAESAVYPEGTFEYTDQTFTVIARGWFVPVSEWTEEDSPMVIDEVDRDLMMGVARQIAGYATTTLLGQSGRTMLSAGGESPSSAIYKMVTKLRVDADTEPNLITMHPNDWADIVTEQASTGSYLFSGAANSQMMMQRWGIPVVPDVGVTEGRVLVLDSNAVRFRDRRSVNVRTAMRFRVSSNLTVPTGQMLHFADARFAFYARYPQGVGDLTL